jgi:hypothetical protein
VVLWIIINDLDSSLVLTRSVELLSATKNRT